MSKVTNEVLNRIRKDEKLVLAIGQGMNRGFRTVLRWIKENNEILASKACVFIIQEETGLSEDQILEPEPDAAQSSPTKC